MKKLSGILLVFILSFNFLSCYSSGFFVDKTNSIDKSTSERINRSLDTLCRFYLIDVYMIAINSCPDTSKFFNEYKDLLDDKSLMFVFPLVQGRPFSINNSRLSDFDYSIFMDIQHVLFPNYSNVEIEEEYPSSRRLVLFANLLCEYLYDVRHKLRMSDNEKRLFVRLISLRNDSIVPERKKYNQVNWQDDEKERRERRRNNNIRDLGNLFKAISLIAGIAIAIYYGRKKK